MCREKSRYEVAYEDYEEYPEAPTAPEEEEKETSTKPDDRKLQKRVN
jgi:hypothetical protein